MPSIWCGCDASDTFRVRKEYILPFWVAFALNKHERLRSLLLRSLNMPVNFVAPPKLAMFSIVFLSEETFKQYSLWSLTFMAQMVYKCILSTFLDVLFFFLLLF